MNGDFRRLIAAIRYQVNRRLNVDIVKASGQHTLRTHLQHLLREYRVEAVLDVGANEGGFGALLRAIGFDGDIYSFEPVTEPYAVLCKQAAKDSRWHAFNFALGSECGTAVINVSKSSQFSSLLPPTLYATDRWDGIAVDHEQIISITTLNELLSQGLLGRERRYLLKMDTQGFDLEVFKGSGDARHSIVCMLSELSLIAVYQGMPHYNEVLAAYEDAGFQVSGFFPITRNRNLALHEVDCVLVDPVARTA